MGPPKTGIGIGGKKPAAVGPQKSLHKSETFFEKVEAAEANTDLPKREPESLILCLGESKHCYSFRVLGGKLAKAGMKQRNLFGQPVVEDADKGAGAKGKKKPAGKEKTKADPKKKSKSPLPGATAEGVTRRKGSETQDAQTEENSHATSNFDSQVEEVETQLEETQLDGSSPVDTEAETQPATQTQTEEEETQPETQVDEEDGEPVSRSTQVKLRPYADHRGCVSIRLLTGQLHRREICQQDRSPSREPGIGFPALCL